ncbi:ATP-binding protein [Pseudomonas sp. v388]|uniref:AAA family ATPase n=1 Tax=Pseudomonas sp. v388 TaxID=2479849 RepID=UPI000F79EB05|nr:ATP-binding protein [Pseudomonas sp. v388]RRV10447.1 ATP-binding protein [Pseudomonas sp. v388]
MPAVQTATWRTWQGHTKQISLLHPDAAAFDTKYKTTILTGQNGSHKSTLLKQLVYDLITPSEDEKPPRRSRTKKPKPTSHVVCVSGSPSDRFPQKEKPGGGRTLFDVPNYTYYGQRVYGNLLSQKLPLETLLTSALNASKKNRYAWNFYSECHRLVGVAPRVEYILSTEALRAKGIRKLLLEKQVDAKADRRGQFFERISFQLAQWFLSEFTLEEFDELDLLLERPRRKLSLIIDPNGPSCEPTSVNVIRLGLLLDIIKLNEAKVCRTQSKNPFSIFELSSGEFHLLTTILGIGFSLEKSSVLLIDEPENNLHPQWQRSLMALIFQVCDHILDDGHLVVSTHSPLIVGSAIQGSTVIDLTDEEPVLTLASYGASSDQLLLNQFGVGSSRNKLVVDTVQKAISLVETNGLDSIEFTSIIPNLLNIRESLLDTDPLVAVIDALLDEEVV